MTSECRVMKWIAHRYKTKSFYLRPSSNWVSGQVHALVLLECLTSGDQTTTKKLAVYPGVAGCPVYCHWSALQKSCYGEAVYCQERHTTTTHQMHGITGWSLTVILLHPLLQKVLENADQCFLLTINNTKAEHITDILYFWHILFWNIYKDDITTVQICTSRQITIQTSQVIISVYYYLTNQ